MKKCPKHPEGSHSPSGNCRECNNEVSRRYRARHPERRKATDAKMKAKDPEAYRLRYASYERERHKRDPRIRLLAKAKERAKARGLACTITLTDIIIPKTCPLLGIAIEHGTKALHAGSPSLDRLLNSKGYVPGNVIVISHKANTCKNDLRADDLMRLARKLRALERAAEK